MTTIRSIILKPGREKSVLRCHPWIFSGGIERIEGAPAPGDTVEIHAHDGTWLARAAYSPQSQIAARVWTRSPEIAINAAFFQDKLKHAWNYRHAVGIPAETNAWRWVHGEADGIPGLVVDFYDGFVVIQCGTVGIERWKDAICDAIMAFPGVKGVYERSDIDSRKREGLEPVCGVRRGEMPPERLVIQEDVLKIAADIQHGHKTGYYLDQRINRRSIGNCVKGAEFLNCFCYSGGFGIRAALDGAAHVTQVDASEDALELARYNASLNNLPEDTFTYTRADVFQLLRSFRDARREFDVIVLDPPKFADTQAQLAKACRGYKDINLLGIKLLKKGGTLLTFSCSSAMTPELFRKVVGDAARDARRVVRVVRTLEQSPDHPQSLDFPEGDYLTGLELRLEGD